MPPSSPLSPIVRQLFPSDDSNGIDQQLDMISHHQNKKIVVTLNDDEDDGMARELERLSEAEEVLRRDLEKVVDIFSSSSPTGVILDSFFSEDDLSLEDDCLPIAVLDHREMSDEEDGIEDRSRVVRRDCDAFVMDEDEINTREDYEVTLGGHLTPSSYRQFSDTSYYGKNVHNKESLIAFDRKNILIDKDDQKDGIEEGDMLVRGKCELDENETSTHEGHEVTFFSSPDAFHCNQTKNTSRKTTLNCQELFPSQKSKRQRYDKSIRRCDFQSDRKLTPCDDSSSLQHIHLRLPFQNRQLVIPTFHPNKTIHISMHKQFHSPPPLISLFPPPTRIQTSPNLLLSLAQIAFDRHEYKTHAIWNGEVTRTYEGSLCVWIATAVASHNSILTFVVTWMVIQLPHRMDETLVAMWILGLGVMVDWWQ